MKKYGLMGSLFVMGVSLSSIANTDPCDFASNSGDTYSWNQVIQCYESVPFVQENLDQLVDVLLTNRQFSDMSELYDERFHWKSNLQQVAQTQFPNDYAMHNALRAEHKKNGDAHIRYAAPACYTSMLASFIPFDFGSTTRFPTFYEKQSIFIEGAPFYSDLYKQQTGIDAEEYVGYRVVEIDGMKVLDYFRKYGRESVGLGTEDSSNLMNILGPRAMFSIRSYTTHAVQPDKPFVKMVLEDRKGKRITKKFPWVFAKRSAMGLGQIPLTSNSEEFKALCLQKYEPDDGVSVRLALDDDHMPLSMGSMKPQMMASKMVSENMEQKMHHYKGKNKNKMFYEVPPNELNKFVKEILPISNAALGLEYKKDTTILRLFNTLGWYDEAREVVEHACQNSKRLIIDLRSNGGGLDDPYVWLYRHLIDDDGQPYRRSGKLPIRFRTDVPVYTDYLRLSGEMGNYIIENGFVDDPEICAIDSEAQCWDDIATEKLLLPSDINWYAAPNVVEERAGVPIQMTRQVGLGRSITKSIFGYLPPTDVASCQGKFQGENLIILTDGANCSGGYFFLTPFVENKVATVVTMGGYVKDPNSKIEAGICRGGATNSINIPGDVARFIEAVTEGDLFMDPLPKTMELDVNSNMEWPAAYRGFTDDLHWDKPVTWDIRMNLWSDSPETDGYVYQEVIKAVKEHYKYNKVYGKH